MQFSSCQIIDSSEEWNITKSRVYTFCWIRYLFLLLHLPCGVCLEIKETTRMCTNHQKKFISFFQIKRPSIPYN